MGRSPCCPEEGLNRGAWTAVEDKTLTDYITAHGEGSWRNLSKRSGLKRSGKSCRLRWLNYLRPDIKRGNISQDEEELIIRLHNLLGNRWSLIAGRLPGRTDNEIKNYWNTNLCRKVQDITNNNSSPSPTKTKTSLRRPANSESGPRVIRTKAVRCTTRVCIKEEPVINSQPPPADAANFDDMPALDFLLDFNVGELCLSDLLNPEISDLRPLVEQNGDINNGNIDFALSPEMLLDLTPGTAAFDGAEIQFELNGD